MAGISIWQLLIILVIVALLFGTKRLRGMGGDLGDAIKGFKKSMSDEPDNKDTEKRRHDGEQKTTNISNKRDDDQSNNP